MTTIWIGLVVAGAVGAPCRYVVDELVHLRTGGVFPWGTLLINATGSFVLGVLTGLALYHTFPNTSKVILGTGFCGAYTTFGTWTFETVRLLLTERFCDRLGDRDAMIGAFIRHNDEVRAGVAEERLLEWTPSDGWEPICERLELEVPAEPFPCTNDTNQWRAGLGLPPV